MPCPRYATGAVIIAESSANLSTSQEAARIPDRDVETAATSGNSLREDTSAAKCAARLPQWEITIPDPPAAARQFFRLRFTVCSAE